MEELNVKLEIFEGPLDLLLHLIKSLEIDIYDIPIAEITEQYISYIHTMQTLELDVAGEYLIMAATLMAIKSKMLLPKQELEVEIDSEEEQGEDPRDALVAQLLEYRKYKYAATVLKDKEEERSYYFTKEPENLDHFKQEIKPLEPNDVTTVDLFLAFHDILERKKKEGPKETTIIGETVSVEDKIKLIKKRLKGKLGIASGIQFDSLFEAFSRDEIVTTFMAVLEMMKTKEITVKQAHNYAPILLFQPSIEQENEEDV